MKPISWKTKNRGKVKIMLMLNGVESLSAPKEMCLVSENGTDVWVEFSILDRPNNEVVLGVMVDITRNKKIEQLITNEKILKNIIDCSSDGILAINSTNNISFLNKKLAEMLELNIALDEPIPLLKFIEHLGARIDLKKLDGLSESLVSGAREGSFCLKNPSREIKWEARDLHYMTTRHIIYFRDVTVP